MMSLTEGKACTHAHARIRHMTHPETELKVRGQVYLLALETSSQEELLVLLSDLDVVDFLLVEDHQGEGLPRQLPRAVPHQVCPIL